MLTENKYLPKAYNHYTVKSITQQGLIRARERNRKAITVQYKWFPMFAWKKKTKQNTQEILKHSKKNTQKNA